MRTSRDVQNFGTTHNARSRTLGILLAAGVTSLSALTYTMIYLPVLNAHRARQSGEEAAETPFANCATLAASCSGQSAIAIVWAIIAVACVALATGELSRRVGGLSARASLLVALLAALTMSAVVVLLWVTFGVIGT